MKLLLIAVVISIHTTGFLTTAKTRCKPLYNGGRGGLEGANVQPKWSFNSKTNHCQVVMVKTGCHPHNNCFPSEDDCEQHCDPWVLELEKQQTQG
uniref:Putative secreted salivary protein n=1 Tax=Ixodes scapularis TaxID=6945 RepID=Q4PMY0_IXOSC|nr:putative secreted salivary protein [Ixodes scapularis]